MAEFPSAFTLTIDYVYGCRITSKINLRFRYGIPELHGHGISSCNSGIPRNSFQFPPIPTNSYQFLPIPTNSHRFLGIPTDSASIQFRNSVAEFPSAFTLTIDYVYGCRITSKINLRFRYGIPELHGHGISSCN